MTNPLHEPDHPIWPLARLVVMMTALTAVLYLSAQNFDNTELTTILTMFLVGAGVEGLQTFLRPKSG